MPFAFCLLISHCSVTRQNKKNGRPCGLPWSQWVREGETPCRAAQSIKGTQGIQCVSKTCIKRTATTSANNVSRQFKCVAYPVLIACVLNFASVWQAGQGFKALPPSVWAEGLWGKLNRLLLVKFVSSIYSSVFNFFQQSPPVFSRKRKRRRRGV